MKTRNERRLMLIGLILFWAVIAILILVKNADRIDGVEEIPQYEAVWRGIVE